MTDEEQEAEEELVRLAAMVEAIDHSGLSSELLAEDLRTNAYELLGLADSPTYWALKFGSIMKEAAASMLEAANRLDPEEES